MSYPATQLAAPSSDLGQFQRGLGSGFLWAIEQPSDRARALIEDCLRIDPRWDHQLDSRGDYYTEIILRTGLDPGFLEQLLDEFRDRDDLDAELRQVIDVVGGLAVRRNRDAVLILRAHVAIGTTVFDALQHLGRTGQPDSWADLDRVVSDRFPDDDDLAYQVDWPPYDSSPWKEWVQSPTRVGEILRRQVAQAEQNRAERHRDYSRMTTDDLLDLFEKKRWHGITEALTERRSPADTAVLLSALDGERPLRATAAFRALALQRDFRVFEPAKRLVEHWPRAPFAGSHRLKQQYPLALLMAAKHTLRSLPCELILPVGRDWRSSHIWRLRRSGIDILRSCATADDVPWVQKQLRRPVTDRRVYAFCDYAEIVARFPEHGPFPALRRAFMAFPYSFGRRFLADAMAATDPEFGSGLAYPSLWDCESAVRRVAVESVEFAAGRKRLEELASDEAEERVVRDAARDRLAGGPESPAS